MRQARERYVFSAVGGVLIAIAACSNGSSGSSGSTGAACRTLADCTTSGDTCLFPGATVCGGANQSTCLTNADCPPPGFGGVVSAVEDAGADAGDARGDASPEDGGWTCLEKSCGRRECVRTESIPPPCDERSCPVNTVCRDGTCLVKTCTSDSECVGFCVNGGCSATRGTCGVVLSAP